METASLANDVDNVESEKGAVTLMTLHAAKGLEFPCVYLVAVEQNILPHERSLRENDTRQLEEERRLLFVGITRAERRLVLTHTLRRETHGRSLSTIPSDFLREMPLESLDCTGGGFSFPAGPYTPFVGSGVVGSGKKEVASPAASKSVVRSGPIGLSDLKSKLMTGAELLAKTDESPGKSPPAIGFQLGMQVRHPRYGTGEVTALEGESRWGTVTVRFRESQREETFIAAKCPLQPLGLR